MSLDKVITLFIAVCGLSVSAAFAQSQTLTFSDYGPNRGSRALAVQWFADEVKSRSVGRLKIDIHWGGALLDGKSTLKGLRDNAADMGTIVGFFAPKELKAYNMGDLVVENADPWIGLRAVYDVASTNETMRKEFDRAGIVYISNYTTGSIQLICVEPVATLDDLKGRKIRGSGSYGKIMNDLGAKNQNMSQADAFQALDSGLLDCNQNYYYGIEAYKQHEVARHLLVLDWGQNMSFGIFMSQIAYDRLDAKNQAVIRAVGKDFIDYFAQVSAQEAVRIRSELESGDGGTRVTVRELPLAERAKLREAGERYIQIWIKEANASGIDGTALLASYQKRIDHYASEKRAKGYPWSR